MGGVTKGDAIVMTDVGQHQILGSSVLPISKRTALVVTLVVLGPWDSGVPAAIGAKIANPDKEVVLFVGDGNFR